MERLKGGGLFFHSLSVCADKISVQHIKNQRLILVQPRFLVQPLPKKDIVLLF